MVYSKLLHAAALISLALADLQQPLSTDKADLSACSTLDFQLPGRVSFRNSDVYKAQTEAYWAVNQGELASPCRIAPRDSADLQQIMFHISRTGTSFAIKSGGHSVVANTSNMIDGITIDLEQLKHVTVYADIGIVDVGVGARWKDVYQKLEGTDYGVVGARAGSVGVGGFLVGGGLSSLSGLLGWACDNVVLLEVVLANGTIVEADHSHHTDLLMALKGGGSNFGVVSRVRLQLVETHSSIDVAFVQYEGPDFMPAVRAITKYNDLAGSDRAAAVSFSLGGRFDGQPPVIVALLSHPQDVFGSKVFAPFFEIGHHLNIHRRMSQLELSLLYDEMNPKGFRQHRTTTTVHNDHNILMDIIQDYVSNLYLNLSRFQEADMQGGLLIQPLTLSNLRHGQSTHPNMLGLQNETSPLLLLSTEMRHSDQQNYQLATPLISEFIDTANKHAAKNNASHQFRYLNYASADQFPFEHIQQNQKLWAEVLAVKQKYDPDNIFGKQMRHPFKIQ